MYVIYAHRSEIHVLLLSMDDRGRDLIGSLCEAYEGISSKSMRLAFGGIVS